MNKMMILYKYYTDSAITMKNKNMMHSNANIEFSTNNNNDYKHR